ncbi:MAG: DUF2946 family protein [Phenylobacterium sp.]
MAAFFAVALLTLAGVKSTVMQAQELAPSVMPADCPMQMAGMKGMAGGDQAHKSTAATCAFCFAAANAPLQSVAEPIEAPVSVAWAAPPPVSDHSPRGPPLVRPKARGPPISLQTV